MINLKEYKQLFNSYVNVICTDGDIIIGVWDDILNAFDAAEDERQEDSILVKEDSGRLVELYVSEIKKIEKA